MAFVTMRQLLDHAAEFGYGLPAFNVNDMEQILAVMAAAAKTESPVILQTSRPARAFAGDAMLRHMATAAVEMYPDIPVCLHQDHGNGPRTCVSAIANGYTSVMMDGSLQEDGKTPGDWAYNVSVTSKVTETAHLVGVSVEGELGVLGSLETGSGEKEDGHGFEGKLDKSQLVTNPAEAVKFAAETHVDALAVAMGTSHGAYKFSRKPTGDILAMDVVREINRLAPNLHMVMHGSSSVPQELQDLLNKYGAKIPQTYGVPLEQIQEGIKAGVRKVNIDTDGRMAITGAIRKFFAENPAVFDPRAFMRPAMAAVQEICEVRFEAFGAAGQAGRIKPVSLSQMAERYRTGALG